MTVTVGEILQSIRTRKDYSPEFFRESQILLSAVLNINHALVIAYPEKKISPKQHQVFLSCLARREKGEPVAYILGRKEFWSLNLNVSQHTLIPRPETELLLESIQATLADKKKLCLLELGTGCGAISLALSCLYPQAKITAVDISRNALKVARQNQVKLQALQIEFLYSNWYGNLSETIKYDAIISNPPYLAENDPHLIQGDLRFEPLKALAGGKNGIECFEKIISKAHYYLKPQGWVFVEHGYEQAAAVYQIFKKFNFHPITLKKDLNSLPRVTFGQLSVIKSRFS